ncbi:uncharacterized protein LOC110762420 [Prunus avium]|uniref:Uncharacterized protein LOC110762420 n=1 Tax=Prunus avium TaxID=42229 RepID=A0A6P5SV56_PRUAV|nr:uncharacterized protein LOC110762420 [Prunus avium]
MDDQGALLATLNVKPVLVERLSKAQSQDPLVRILRLEVENGTRTYYSVKNDRTLMVGTRLYVPEDETLKREILEEAHCSAFAMYLGHTKMYRTLRALLVAFLEETDCREAFETQLQFGTAFRPQTDGQSERMIQTLENMLRACALQFRGNWDEKLPLMEFVYNNSFQESIGMSPFDALYGKHCRTPLYWDEVGEHKLRVSGDVERTMKHVETIREMLKVAQERQKSHANNRRKDLQFEVGDWTGLPADLSRLHDVFHVSMLRKYISDPSHVLEEQPKKWKDDLSYVEQPVQITDRKMQLLRSREIPLVKVLWRSHDVEEATWGPEEQVLAQYTYLFE